MATIYSGQRWNGDGTCYWRIRVDYSTNSASVYADVGPSGWSIWLRFTTGSNTCWAAAKTYYASNNGASGNKLGDISISPYSAYTVYQTCSGSSWGGSVNGESSVTIPKQATPSAPTCSVSITNIGVDSATCTGQITNNPENYWRIHLYNTAGAWQTYATGTSSCSFTQTGLAHNTTYNFYHQYTNSSDGEGSGLIAHSFTTSGNPPTATGLLISDVARTTATVGINGYYDTNASWGGYELQYGTTTSYGTTVSSSSLTGLTPNTTYYCKGRFKDNWNRWSGYVTDSFTTTGNAPTASHNSAGDAIGRTYAQLGFSYTCDTNASYGSSSCVYGTTTSYGSTATADAYNHFFCGGTGEGGTLAPNTTYYYKFTITDNWGRTSNQVTGSFTTSGNPPTISNVSGTAGETTYGFTYTATYDTNAAYSSIENQWGTTTSYGSYNNTNAISGLTPDTHYYHRFRVTDTKGHTSNWYTDEFTTLASTTLKIKVNGVWKDATPYVNVNGTWKKAKAYMKISGTWKQGKS